MFKFLFLIAAFFALMVILMGFSVFRAFRTMLFGSSDNKSRRENENRRRRAEQQRREREEEQERMKREASAQKKIFSKDDGEYVDYEEIK